jgi:glycosyltransferase involved in cell wall biosynthesis
MTLDHRDSVDVIIPARGTTPWLELSLSSLAAQSFQPAAIILIDDGLAHLTSTEELGQKLFGRRFRLLRNDGQGISAALNTGVQHSDAHWIARMDTDDVAHPQRLERQILFLKDSPGDVLGCGTQVRFVNSDGQALAYPHLPFSWDDVTKHLLSRTCFVHSSLVIRRESLITTLYRPPMDGAEDVDLVLRLSEKGKFLNLNQVLMDYRIHMTQESFRMRARHTAVQELAFRLALSRRKKHHDPLEIDPQLAEKFIQWRLSTPEYVRSRTFLTALRYMGTYLAGLDLKGFAQCFLVALGSLPVLPQSIFISWRVSRKAAAALLDEPTPFAALNLN